MNFEGHRHITKKDGSTEDSWRSYKCGHCNERVSGAVVARYKNKNSTTLNEWLLCTGCGRGSAFVGGSVYPGTSFGPEIQGLSDEVSHAYKEARSCVSFHAYTAAELICRKILMHVAVDKGAKEGESFAKYLTHLEQKGYITPPMKGWVDLIRKNGNKSTHKLEAPDEKRAESTVMLTAELLRLVYEMEFMANQYSE